MFNIGAGEMVLILVAALLVLGPQRLPELARAIGKFMREFRRHTDDVRNVVEREFYAMDQEVNREPPPMGRPGSRFTPPDAAPPAVPVPVPPQVAEAVTPAEPAQLPETTAASIATESLVAPSEPEPALAPSSPAPTPIPGTVARNAPKRS
ncbi:twin-arginine translocase subunit TatB [Corallococcus sp. H22C18031201]|nr:twin-arginine translocase subunit TatB [Corallococcus sp. H22C18031201]